MFNLIHFSENEWVVLFAQSFVLFSQIIQTLLAAQIQKFNEEKTENTIIIQEIKFQNR